MGSRSRDDHRGYELLRAALLKIAAIAVALGVVTWLLAPILLPVRVPQDFPKLPDFRTVNPSVRAVLESADQEARRRPGSAEAVGKLGMAYHANLFLEQAAASLSDCRAVKLPGTINGRIVRHSSKRRAGTKRKSSGYCRRRCG